MSSRRRGRGADRRRPLVFRGEAQGLTHEDASRKSGPAQTHTLGDRPRGVVAGRHGRCVTVVNPPRRPSYGRRESDSARAETGRGHSRARRAARRPASPEARMRCSWATGPPRRSRPAAGTRRRLRARAAAWRHGRRTAAVGVLIRCRPSTGKCVHLHANLPHSPPGSALRIERGAISPGGRVAGAPSRRADDHILPRPQPGGRPHVSL